MRDKPNQIIKYSSSALKKIFIQNQVLILIHFPFESMDQFSQLQRLSLENELSIKKLSKRLLRQQNQKDKSNFIPLANSSYLLIEKNKNLNIRFKTFSSFLKALNLIGGVIIFAKSPDERSGKEIWSDYPRLTNFFDNTRKITVIQPWFEFLIHRSILPLCLKNIYSFLQLLRANNSQRDRN